MKVWILVLLSNAIRYIGLGMEIYIGPSEDKTDLVCGYRNGDKAFVLIRFPLTQELRNYLKANL